MKISNIELINFRNYTKFNKELSPKLNWVYGSNGQGKTNLIEAINYLCNLESFRTKKVSNIIQKNYSDALIKATVERQKLNHYITINLSRKGRQVFVNKKPSYHVSEYVLSFMAIAFTPESVNLFRNAPQERRKFFNKIISFFSPIYFKNLNESKKIILQKNALLRIGNIEQISIWNKMLARTSKILIEQRKNFVKQINLYLRDHFFALSGRSEKLSLKYEPSLNSKSIDEKSYISQLEKNLQKELHKGFSIIGPHRDEFHLMIDEKKDKDFFSQGEFRITNLSLKMTINRLLYEKYNFYPILIFDDLFSELDEKVINHIIQVLIKINNQVFITSTFRPSYSLPGKFIKIEHGFDV